MPRVRAGYPFRGTIAWDICQEAPAVVPHGCNVQYAGRIGARLSVVVWFVWVWVWVCVCVCVLRAESMGRTSGHPPGVAYTDGTWSKRRTGEYPTRGTQGEGWLPRPAGPKHRISARKPPL